MRDIVFAVFATLGVTKLYRLSPLCDTGSAIWHTRSKVHMDTTVRIFKRFVAGKTINIGDDAVARQMFPGTSDIINRTLDANLAAELDGVTAARALVKHNPFRVARQISDELFRQGFDAKLIRTIPHTKQGHMVFVVVKGQGWMYVIRRHAIVMMIAQLRQRRNPERA